MIEIGNRILRLTMKEDGSGVVLADLMRGCAWELDASRLGFRRRGEADLPCALYGKMPLPFERFADGKASRQGDTIGVEYRLPDGPVRYTWTIEGDHVRVALQCVAAGLDAITLPGAWYPVEGRVENLWPVYQGVLARGDRKQWERSDEPGGHLRFTLSMAAVLGERGGLLVTQETTANWFATYGQGERGPFFCFEQQRCPAEGWTAREVRLYPLERDITAVCKRYRRRLIERGEFVSWQEKIARKPILKNLFGALMAFIGYNKTPEIDYVESARKLKAFGFDSILYYPVRMLHYSLNYKMGGDDPIWLSDDEIRGMKAIPGTLVAPWGWNYEALDDGSAYIRGIYRHDAGGKPRFGWRIDQQVWNTVCTPYHIEAMRRRYESDMREMDWMHYDVVACRPGVTCHNRQHTHHAGRVLGRREDLEWIRKLLGPETNGNRIVSSEGFVDHYAGSYDIGASKLFPASGDIPYVPIPMTMLVLHDSVVHDWWEIHNYNLHESHVEDDCTVGVNGCGRPEQKSAMDALYGCPPNVFPFGKQYTFVDMKTMQTRSFLVRLEDAAVQQALRAALPVAKLHKRTGPQELVSFEFLSADFAAQSTVFADGTRVVANVSDAPVETLDHGVLPPNSWREA